jgi:nicotinate-nucleotide pyrophosphorylase (carboxylating)
MQIIEKAFQHGHRLSLSQKEYRTWVSSFLKALLKEDTKKEDVTTNLLFPNLKHRMMAEIVAKQDGIMAGMEEFQFFCTMNNIKIKPFVQDGTQLPKGKKIAELLGTPPLLLKIERTGLDLIGRMSGIATTTHNLTQRIKKVSQAKLSATRKTLWGPMDKKAVFLGGGLTHRLGLWQALLIKENHLEALRNSGARDPFAEAIHKIASRKSQKKIAFLEIETESVQEALHVGKLFVENLNRLSKVPLAILLDNFTPQKIRETIRRFEQNGWREKILLEASGGITEENLEDYAKTGVDLISLGTLTHSAKNFDFSQRIVSQGKVKG